MNEFIVVGKILDTYNDNITLKDSFGNKLTVYIPDNIRKNVRDLAKIGDTVGVKGKIKENYGMISLEVEKFSFLTSGNN